METKLESLKTVCQNHSICHFQTISKNGTRNTTIRNIREVMFQLIHESESMVCLFRDDDLSFLMLQKRQSDLFLPFL